MMTARGNVRKILKTVGQIQELVGGAIANHFNDRDPNSFEKAQAQLQEAFDLCLEIRGMYKPID